MRERDLDRYIDNLEKIVLRKERQTRKLKSGARLSDLSRCMAHGLVTPFRALRRDIERLIGETSPPIEPELPRGGECVATDTAAVGRKDLDRLRERLRACCRLIDGMLDNLIAGTWTPPVPVETIDLNRVVDRFVDQLIDHGGAGAPRIVLRLNRHIPGVEIRECDCFLVIHNLIMNAIESVSTGENGKVIIRTDLRGDNAMIEVTDNGAGIPEEIAESIFKPSYSTKWMPDDKFRHPGLGLYTAARIVEQNGGLIEHASRQGKTTFIVLLPIQARPERESRREGPRGMETKIAGLSSVDAEDEGIPGIVR